MPELPEPMTIPLNVKEKIVVCLDLTEDEDEAPIGFGDQKLSVESVVRAAVRQFFILKAAMRSDTEFAIVGMLNSKAKLINQFSTDINEVNQVFPTNKPSKPVEVNMDEFLFPILEQALKDHLPTVSSDGVLSHVCRVILVYKSSVRIPLLNNFNYKMFESPGVLFDVFYVHDVPSDQNHVEHIFENMSKLNISGNSYLLEVLNNQIINIYNTMSLLLPHPLQRAPQKYLNNDIRSILSDKQDEEIPTNEDGL
uniref:BRISC and BRCA1-A complex member 1 n=1 Tax=Cacopsylla melanoneura TaxID=428564 RepID=A0A8D8S5X3_9HEMI